MDLTFLLYVGVAIWIFLGLIIFLGFPWSLHRMFKMKTTNQILMGVLWFQVGVVTMSAWLLL